MPAISVVIPTFNCGPYLGESLDSIFAQTFRDLEVIVVDDGSTDNTPEVLEAYRGRLRVLPGPHAGLSAARNACLAVARGEWIAFHDADDVALPDRLAFQLQCLATAPDADAVFCNGVRMDTGAAVIPPTAPVARPRLLTVRDLFAGFPIYFQGALVRREVFARCGPFATSFRIQPDIEYGYRLLTRCQALFVDRVVFRYRWHTTNNSRDLVGGREDISRVLEALLAEEPDAVRSIGRHRIMRRLARNYYRLACRYRPTDPNRAQATLVRAARLYPWPFPYYLLRYLRAQ